MQIDFAKKALFCPDDDEAVLSEPSVDLINS